MIYLLIILIAIVVFCLAIVIRNRLSDQQDRLFNSISNSNTTSAPYTGLSTHIQQLYSGIIISCYQKNEIKNNYSDIYNKAVSTYKRLKLFGIAPNKEIIDLIHEFESIDSIVKDHNDNAISHILQAHSSFFETCLTYPLDEQQRRAIVSGEDNCLVVSSAGSGKTSSIVGKVKYLTDIKGIDPDRILLISYTNKAAAELTERIATPGLKGYTFHKLALDIIGMSTKTKPSICDNTDALFINIYHKLLSVPSYKHDIVDYFAGYLQYDDDNAKQNERREQLSDQKKNRLKAIFPDMDGNTVYVRSEQERAICFALTSLGIKFRYEEAYEYPLANEYQSQYHPDFSIHYEVDGIAKRLYIEHFGVDEHGMVPIWFAKDKNISYEEANKRYNDGITWKRAAHEKFGTTLIETSSADFKYHDIKQKLKQSLQGAGVPIHEKSDIDLYDSMQVKDSKQEKAFIRLAATYITLLKSSGKSFQQAARQAIDKRSQFLIENLFRPIYEMYSEALHNAGQIDFTDAIIQATEICKTSRPVAYDYIIVDEFQDISFDRYKFLIELRRGNPPAKLYCVGDDWQSIYRFSGSDMSLFNQFPDYFGPTEINKIETTYRFGEPLVSLSSKFIQRNNIQIKKDIRPFNINISTNIEFRPYEQLAYCNTIEQIIGQLPADKSIFLLGRYSFDDYYLSYRYKSTKRGNNFSTLSAAGRLNSLPFINQKDLRLIM